MEQALYWLWAADVLGPASPYLGPLLEDYGSARTLYEAARSTDLSEVLPAGAAGRAAALEPAQFAPVLERCAGAGIAVLTPEDPDYPAPLRTLGDRPAVLYATGSTRCLNGGQYVGMVGTRRPSAYGVQACHEISAGLARGGAVVVSGLADGLDSEGHRAAVGCGAPTIGFLGTPIDTTYPAANRTLRRQIEQQVGGAVVSEFAPGSGGDRRVAFLQRNRLIAGMSAALCVAEARTRSGTMNTVGHAERYGRPVFAVPGSIFSPVSEGTNELLAAGRAHMLRSAQDVLALLAQQRGGAAQPEPAAEEPEFSPDACTVRAALGPEPRSVEQLCAACKLGAGAVLAALTELEFSGAAAAAGGRRYTAL